MSQDYSKDEIPENTIVITRSGWEDRLYYIDDLLYMSEMEAGQLFNAVARYYNKTRKDYGIKWPRFSTPLGEKSKAFSIIENNIKNARTDYDRLVLVCKQLDEETPDLTEEEE